MIRKLQLKFVAICMALVTLVMAMAVADGIRKTCDVSVGIKWPNDIWVEDRKICGILIENIIDGNRMKACLIGIGLNINEEGWPENLPNPVSLKELTGKEYDVRQELQQLVGQISRHSEMLLSSDGRNYLEQEFSRYVFRLPEGL